MPLPEKFIHNNKDEVAQACYDFIIKLANECIQSRGQFILSLAGGSTPAKLYQLLGKANQNWDNWILIYGDERALPSGHPDRNETMVRENWLSKVNFPENNHLKINFEEPFQQTAVDYSEKIKPYQPIDLALLGMGEDGHTASLFPGKTIQREPVILVEDSPKPPAQRISLNYPTLKQARNACFLVTGKDKVEALQQWQAGEDLPAANIQGQENTYIFLDAEAANIQS